MTDTHQFHGLLRKLKIGRRQALQSIGEDFAWKLEPRSRGRDDARSRRGRTADHVLRRQSRHASRSIPARSPTSQPMGPWLNIMDPTFHLHLRTDHIAEIWAVRKPTADGHVTSLEALDAKGEMVIQFFGKRKEGFAERAGMALDHGKPRPARHHRGSLKDRVMKTLYDFRRLRSWELALARLAVPPVRAADRVAEAPSFVRAAVAQEMQKADTSRLVSVGGAITEIVYALGEEGRLVGRDSTSIYPEAATKLPDVGYMRQLVAGRRDRHQSDAPSSPSKAAARRRR